MPKEIPARDKLRARTDEHSYLGTDGAGHEHYWDHTSHVAWIATADGIRQPQRVEDLSEYVEHVEGVAGWDTLRYDARPLASAVADSVDKREVA